jgi:hypothetical protein
MPPQAAAPAPTQVPTGQVNPMMMALLRRRAMMGAQGQPGAGPMPNGVPTGGPPAPMGMPPAGGPGMPGPGAASPTQQVTKAAAQAQSPLLDQQTRGIAKSLIQKLMQHM